MRRCMTRWTSSGELPDQVLAAPVEPLDPAPADRVGDLDGGAGSHQRGSSTSISSMRRPSTAGASWRRIVSTSGSSGIATEASS